MIALYIILILLQLGVIVFFVRRGRKQKQDASKTKPAASNPASGYEGLRNTALNISPAQLNLKIPDSETLVYGVVMDCNVGNAVVTLSAYITGAVSMYFSTGGGKTGGMYPEIAESAVDFVTTAQGYIGRAIKVATTELPSNGCVRFYLLTNSGIYVAQEQLAYFENSSSAWQSLFEKGNDIIGQMHNSGNGNIV